MIDDKNTNSDYQQSENCLLPTCSEQKKQIEVLNSDIPNNHKIDSHCNTIDKKIIIKEKQDSISKHVIIQNIFSNQQDIFSSTKIGTKKDKTIMSEALNAVNIARKNKRKGNNGVLCGAAIKLPNGDIISGTNSPLFHSATAVIIKACKSLIGLPADVFLLSSFVIESIGKMKEVIYQTNQPCLNVRELLIALAVQGPMNPSVSKIIELFPKFKGCEMYLTHIPTLGDQSGLEKLGINFSYDPISASQ